MGFDFKYNRKLLIINEKKYQFICNVNDLRFKLIKVWNEILIIL